MFNGTPVFEQISPTALRITGLSLSPNTSGTLGFSDAGGIPPAPDVLLPATFPRPTSSVPLRALLKVDISPESAGPLTNLPPSIEKTGEGEDFRIEVTNTKVDLATQTLEIYLTVLGQDQGTSVLVQNSPGTSVTINSN